MDPMKGAQDVIRCDVCSDKEREKSPAEVHCNTCHTNVCSPCVARHMALDKSKKHDIVLFHVVGTEIILPSCSSHPQLKCDLFCKICSIPICLKCLSSNHNSHTVEEVTEMCQKICKDIQNESEELQQRIIPDFEKISGEEDEKLKKLNEAYDKLDSSIEEHGKDLHRKVDAVIFKYKAEVQQKKQADAKILQQQMEEVNEILSEAKQAAVKNKALLKSKNASSLIANKSKNANLSKVPNLRNIVPPDFTPKPIPADFLDSVFGEIPDSKIVYKQGSTVQPNDNQVAAVGASTDKVLSTFSTPYKQLYRLACTRSGQLWTSGNENTLRCLNMHTGSIVATAVLGLNPIAICVNTANELLICVSDTASLVVLDRTGKFRFRYHGKVFDTFDKPFKPRGVSTDSQGNIFLADLDNRCIHVLDKDGRFVRYITCGGSLDKLCDVNCDENGRLCRVANNHSPTRKCE